jgi:Short C-terminal domain
MKFFARKQDVSEDDTDAVAAGDVPPEAKEVVEQLEHMFPGAHIAVESKSISDPAQVQAALQAALGSAAGGESARIAELERIAKLHEQGALTDDEFAAEKKKILGS